MRAIATAIIVLFSFCSITAVQAEQSNSCKQCREQRQACTKNYSAKTCKTEYDICMKGCQKKYCDGSKYMAKDRLVSAPNVVPTAPPIRPESLATDLGGTCQSCGGRIEAHNENAP